MDTFKSIRLYFNVLGINPSQSDQNDSNSAKPWLILLATVSTFVSGCVFFFREAQTFDQYTDAFNIIFSFFFNSITLLIYILIGEKLFIFMSNFNVIIQNSE